MATEAPQRVIYSADAARKYLADRGLEIGKNSFYSAVREKRIRSTSDLAGRFWFSKRELDRVLGLIED